MERHGIEYYRHGTLSLYAALDTLSGEVYGETAPLNQVEIWFSKIERDVIARGVFTSTADLRRKILRYIRRYNRNARPIRWSYSDPTRRILPATGSSLTDH